MQGLSESTSSSVDDAAVCAGDVLDHVPQVMWFIRRHLRPRRTKSLSLPQFRSLFMLRGCPGSTLSAVADNLGATLPTASRMVDGLVARGLVSRKACSQDRRQITLHLTAKGESVLQTARDGASSAVAERLGRLSVAQRAKICEALADLAAVTAPGTEEGEADRKDG